MDIKEQLRGDLTTAMKQGDNFRRDVLRMMVAASKETEVDSRVVLDNEGVQEVLRKQVKQRQESIEDYGKAGRRDEVERELSEIAIVESYLPRMMTRDEVEQLASPIVEELEVTDIKGMGQVMGRLMPLVRGRADGRLVNEVVRDLLT